MLTANLELAGLLSGEVLDPSKGEDDEEEVEDADKVTRRKRTRKVNSVPQKVVQDDPPVPLLAEKNGSQDEELFGTDLGEEAVVEEGNSVQQDTVRSVPPTDTEMGGTTGGEDFENATDENGKLIFSYSYNFLRLKHTIIADKDSDWLREPASASKGTHLCSLSQALSLLILIRRRRRSGLQ